MTNSQQVNRGHSFRSTTTAWNPGPPNVDLTPFRVACSPFGRFAALTKTAILNLHHVPMTGVQLHCWYRWGPNSRGHHSGLREEQNRLQGPICGRKLRALRGCVQLRADEVAIRENEREGLHNWPYPLSWCTLRERIVASCEAGRES